MNRLFKIASVLTLTTQSLAQETAVEDASDNTAADAAVEQPATADSTEADEQADN